MLDHIYYNDEHDEYINLHQVEHVDVLQSPDKVIVITLTSGKTIHYKNSDAFQFMKKWRSMWHG